MVRIWGWQVRRNVVKAGGREEPEKIAVDEGMKLKVARMRL